MSDTENGQSTGIVGTVINELEQTIEHLVHPSVSGAGGAALGEATGSLSTQSSSDSALNGSGSTQTATSGANESPLQPLAGDAGNVVAASGAIAGAPDAVSPSALTGLSSDQSGAATNGASDDPNAGASTEVNSASSLTDSTAATAITQHSSVGDVAIDAGTAVLAAAEESASAAADALLARWHREMSLLGRGLSAETEKLIRETAAYLGL
ncbi:hypothetical protein [Burkholderia cepacia]|uniref:hypothetical protein n=1 Tax=Burkholderia cepacia TaxID=292 RepID=UPI001CF59CF4|nr:hypothetical protein [Burkholderia cepacia]MCA8075366.1 hypothetical protein [Burkholderia cepacia]